MICITNIIYETISPPIGIPFLQNLRNRFSNNKILKTPFVRAKSDSISEARLKDITVRKALSNAP